MVRRMSITQTIEQHITGRPALRVPGESVIRFFQQCFRFAKDNSRVCQSSSRKGKGKAKENSPPPPEPEDDSELSNLTESPSEEPEPSATAKAMTKWGVYFGQGALLGGVRGVLSYYGARGVMTDLVFMGLMSSGDTCSFWREMTENVPL